MKAYVSLDNYSYITKPKDRIPAIKRRTMKNWREMGVSELADLVGNKGHAMIPAHLEGGMSADCCKSMQLFGVDFDDGCSFNEIRTRCELWGLAIAFAYHTYSSTKEKEKFRVVFIHECPIEDVFIIRLIIMMLYKIFPECDQACKNLDRIFLGGKELIYVNDKARIALVQLLLPLYNALDNNNHFKRNVYDFSKKSKVLLVNDRLAIGEETQIMQMVKNGEKMDSVIIHNITGSAKSPIVVEKGRVHQSLKCRIPKKKLDIDEETSCQLLNDFKKGIEIRHIGRFAIATNLVQIVGGEKYFFEVLKKYYSDSIPKWEKDIRYMKGYFPQRCSGSFCPYYAICENAGTIVDTLAMERKVYRKEEVLYTIEEAVNCLTENMERALSSPEKGIHLIKAQTGIGKTAVYIKLVKNSPANKFIVALPTNRLKEEVYGRFLAAGIHRDDIFMTKSVHGNPLIPLEIGERISRCHDRGLHNLTNRILGEYCDEIKNDPNKAAVRKECEQLIEGLSAIKEERIIVTTHSYLLFMQERFLKEYTVIIDEDFLQLYIMNQIFSVSVECLQKLVQKGYQPYAGVAIQMIRAEEGIYYKLPEEKMAVPLDVMQMEELYCEMTDNINDLARAGAFVKMKEKTGKQVVTYFHPLKLPEMKAIILSATINEKIYRAYFKNKLSVYTYPEKKARYRGKLIQFTYHSLGRKDLISKPQVYSYIKERAGKDNLEVITFKEHPVLMEEADMNTAGIHFGNATGVNDLEGKTIGIVGTPFKRPEAYKLLACYLGEEVNQKIDERPKIRRVNYKNCSFLITTYHNDLLNELLLYSLESELEQCVGRARLLRNECKVYLLSCFPCEQAELHISNYLGKRSYDLKSKSSKEQ